MAALRGSVKSECCAYTLHRAVEWRWAWESSVPLSCCLPRFSLSPLAACSLRRGGHFPLLQASPAGGQGMFLGEVRPWSEDGGDEVFIQAFRLASLLDGLTL